MRKILFAVLISLLLCSCELITEFEGKSGRLWIVSYGNTYEDSGPLVLNDEKALYAGTLYGTVNDAVQVCNALIGWAERTGVEYDASYILGKETRFAGNPSYGYQKKLKGYPCESENPKGSITVYDGEGDTSVSRFRSCLEKISMESNPEDMTIIFFSGHGFRFEEKEADDVSKTGFLVFSDNEGGNLELLSCSDLLSSARGISGTKIILGDFCYSGCLIQNNGVSLNGNCHDTGLSDFLELLSGNVIEESSLFCLSACEYFNTSSEISKEAHGFFTMGLLDALNWNEEDQGIDGNDTEICLSDICRIVKDSSHEGKTQNCIASGGSNDVVIFRLK